MEVYISLGKGGESTESDGIANDEDNVAISVKAILVRVSSNLASAVACNPAPKLRSRWVSN